MKRLSPYWVLPLLHFAAVAATAFAVRDSNGINVRDFRGGCGLWMDLGNRGNRVVSFTRWAVPVMLLFVLLLTRGKKKEAAWFTVGAVGVIMVTWPLYAGLIHFWERDWGSG